MVHIYLTIWSLSAVVIQLPHPITMIKIKRLMSNLKMAIRASSGETNVLEIMDFA